MSVPPGFKPHFRKSPLTDPWEPLYSKRTEDAVIIGIEADTQHCNSRGFVHGGLISALADNAMGLSCAARHENVSGLVTISLHLDFVRPARIGQWLEFETTFLKPGSNIDSAQGRVLADGEVCALAGAIFRVQTTKKV
ncbi:MAG: PaaI family thioesterase [Parasphingopyxis sp.]|uniref:PaaI family thioesterase n=1 Tax=Parasphingopyxis sp. TaxID=1920299 RepID=UPI003F9F1ED6